MHRGASTLAPRAAVGSLTHLAISAYGSEFARSDPLRGRVHGLDLTSGRPLPLRRRSNPRPSTVLFAPRRRTQSRRHVELTARSWPKHEPCVARSAPRLDILVGHGVDRHRQSVEFQRSGVERLEGRVLHQPREVFLSRVPVVQFRETLARSQAGPLSRPAEIVRRASDAAISRADTSPSPVGKLAARSRHVPAPFSMASERCGTL